MIKEYLKLRYKYRKLKKINNKKKMNYLTYILEVIYQN